MARRVSKVPSPETVTSDGARAAASASLTPSSCSMMSSSSCATSSTTLAMHPSWMSASRPAPPRRSLVFAHASPTSPGPAMVTRTRRSGTPAILAHCRRNVGDRCNIRRSRSRRAEGRAMLAGGLPASGDGAARAVCRCQGAAIPARCRPAGDMKTRRLGRPRCPPSHVPAPPRPSTASRASPPTPPTSLPERASVSPFPTSLEGRRWRSGAGASMTPPSPAPRIEVTPEPVGK